MGKGKLLLAIAALAVTSPTASGSFIFEDAQPVVDGGWTQQIIATSGPNGIDYVTFEILSDGGSVQLSLTNFGDPDNANASIAGWSVISGNGTTLVTAGGPEVAVGDSIAFTLYFDGDWNGPLVLQGGAFLNGEFQFSYESEYGGAGFETGAPPPLAVPLPAPIWLGSVGLLALLVLRRRVVS